MSCVPFPRHGAFVAEHMGFYRRRSTSFRSPSVIVIALRVREMTIATRSTARTPRNGRDDLKFAGHPPYVFALALTAAH